MIMRRSIRLLTAIVMACLLLLMPVSAMAFSPFGDVCSNSGNTSSAVCSSTAKNDAHGNPLNPLTGASGTLGAITTIVAFIAGAAAIIIIVVSALRFITAGGDANKVTAARSTLTGAIIGLAVIVLAKVLIDFVLSKL
jgi:uncharacterized membrane protein